MVKHKITLATQSHCTANCATRCKTYSPNKLCMWHWLYGNQGTEI